jgi:hypothetical protein
MVHPGSSAAAAMSLAKHADAGCVEVVALQPVAVVDHLGRPVSKDFLNRNVAIGGHELGGSERVDPSELASLLSKLEADGTDTRDRDQGRRVRREHRAGPVARVRRQGGSAGRRGG